MKNLNKKMYIMICSFLFIILSIFILINKNDKKYILEIESLKKQINFVKDITDNDESKSLINNITEIKKVIDDQNNLIKDLKTNLDKQNNDLSSVKSENKKLKNEIINIRNQNYLSRSEFDNFNKNISEKLSKLETGNLNLIDSVSKDELEKLKKFSSELKEKISKLEDKDKSLTLELEKIKNYSYVKYDDLTSLKNKIKDNKENLDKANENIVSNKSNIERLNNEDENIKSSLLDINSKILSTNNKITKNEEELSLIKTNITSLNNNFNGLNNNFDKLTAGINGINENIESLTLDNKNIKENTNLKNTFLKSHGVGSIYITVSEDENTVDKMEEKYGGKWEVYGSGKTIVSVDTNNSKFSTVQKEGGTSSVKLTTDNLPSHSHNINITNLKTNGTILKNETTDNDELFGTVGSIMFNDGSDPQPYGTGIFNIIYTERNRTWQGEKGSNAIYNVELDARHEHTFDIVNKSTDKTGTNESISIQNPYITVFMYKRVK